MELINLLIKKIAKIACAVYFKFRRLRVDKYI